MVYKLTESKLVKLKASSPFDLDSSCRITVNWIGTTEDTKLLSYPIKLEGIECEIKTIKITLSISKLPGN